MTEYRARRKVAERTGGISCLGPASGRLRYASNALSKLSLFRSREAWHSFLIDQQLKGGDPMSSGILRTAMSRSQGLKADLPLVAA